MWKKLLVLAAGLLSFHASAATYYVSTAGNDTAPTGDGTIAKPWRTLAKGIGSISGGDTLYIRGGQYPDTGVYISASSILPSGPSTNSPTRVMGYPGEIAILKLDEGSAAAGWAQHPSQARSNIWLSDFVWDCSRLPTSGSGTVGINFRNMRFLTITNVHFRESWLAVTAMLYLGNRHDHVGVEAALVTHCSFTNYLNYSDPGGTAPPSHAIYSDWIGNSTFEDNTFYAPNSSDVGGSYTFHFSSNDSNVADQWPVAPFGTNNVVQRNWVYSRDGGIALYSAFSKWNKIRNNVFINVGTHTPCALLGTYFQTNQVDQNVFYGGAYALQALPYGTIHANLFRNNIFWKNSRTGIFFDSAIGEVNYFTNNLVNSIADASSIQVFSGSLVNVNPLFIGAPSDLRPSPNSPTRDAGISLSGIVDEDFLGVSRPQDSLWDIGPYELSAVTPPDPPGFERKVRTSRIIMK